MAEQDDFFIGWSGRLARASAWRVRAATAGLACVFLLAGLLLARAIDDPGGGDGLGERTIEGVLTALPYPTITMAPSAAHPRGHSVMLSGLGKDAAPFDRGLDGRQVVATGYMLQRGALEMLQVGAPLREAASPTSAAVVAPAVVEPLGRWRITGEICDGKCLAGAMRPGSGIAHRACANLCVSGGVPPVFVATGPVEGATHLLLGDGGGGPLNERFRELMALRVTLEGPVERRGDLLVFRPDLAGAVVR